MEAKKTTYMYKEYRSKTEAMFALLLDITKKEHSRFVYEEKRFKTPDNYVADFVFYEGMERFLADFISIIEVKPSIPTNSYLKYLTKQFNWIKYNDKFYFIDRYCLIIFNPYKRLYKESFLIEGNDWSELYTPDWFKDEYFDIVLNYRFDLI